MAGKPTEHHVTCSLTCSGKKRMSTSTDRDSNGRFRPGHPGGPGRPRRAIEADYLASFSDAVPMEAWKRIVGRAVEDAEKGDAKAREWLSAHLMAKPDGNGLLMLAASEEAGFNPIAEKADGLALRTLGSLGSLLRPKRGTAHDDRE
jgi:hypothetical protein